MLQYRAAYLTYNVSRKYYSFWVCEKTDGVRVMLLILWNAMQWKQDLFLVSVIRTL
jgi:hypothetical protein